MSIKKAVVLRFMEICKDRNLTLNKLANLSGVTPSTVYSMVNDNRKDLSIITVKKLCDGLDISITEFFKSNIFLNLEQEIL